MTKLSQVVVKHVETLLDEFDSPVSNSLSARPRHNLEDHEQRLFWRYHGHFPQEFTQALINRLPEQCTFVSYDHLRNKITVR